MFRLPPLFLQQQLSLSLPSPPQVATAVGRPQEVQVRGTIVGTDVGGAWHPVVMNISSESGVGQAPEPFIDAAASYAAVSHVALGDAALNDAALSDAALLGELERAFAAHRDSEARLVQLAGEVARRSTVPDGLADGLADRYGCTSPAALLAQVGGGSQVAAARWVRLAAQVHPRIMLSGDVVPPLFPLAGAALNDLQISADAATAIVTALASASPRADLDDLVAAETALVAFAREHPADTVRTLAAQWREALDPDGLEPAELVERRSLRRTMTATGLKRFTLDLDPEGAAYLDAAIDSAVGAGLRTPRFEDPDDETTLPEPALSVAQLGADAIVDLARHGIACDNTSVPIPAATVVVRMSLESLLDGTGLAEIDGAQSTIPADVARRIAADAHIIPAVLGGPSEVLDWGQRRRLFSPAQRLALAERDGGCAWADCNRPPSYTEAHHIRWWQAHAGPTDLSNGVLLCSKHHHAVHNHGWAIEVRDNVPWFIPPSTVDATRRPRRGGRLPAPHLARAG